MHDDIGSTLNSISIYSQIAQQDPDKKQEALEMIGDGSRKVIDAMSDIVWTVNPDNDSFEDIILRMRSLAFNLFRAKNIEFTFRAEETLNHIKLSIERRRNLFLIFKESLNNLVKYSEATLVSIQLFSEGSNVKLIIRDNGKGFDTLKPANGNGLNNMRIRAKEMKSQFQIDSSLGEGTNTELLLKIMSIRVAIYEDNHNLRESLYQLIDGTDGFRCAGAFANCDLMIKNWKRPNRM